ncbi:MULTISPECIES: BRCT domain-containing protein [Xanthomonas translucens group]|uniref:BRCT domain-containing protein n=1 Tax=Xanthomonas translucens group TaxID=3390202 RepID=UPI0009B7684D|nr:BRCT domain-containing protein [Xanthomonas translucens]MCT8283561.1 hypothetical protein [Xanthomonas translucens pv. undulosa]MCT8318340.1 hypothetical protein [Xanthomonas translucens pv. undulosa]QSQ56477.1 hypothetical protein ISN37_19545 [Xanthomonas translucens pv. undulosa]UKE40063.1 hypothetical protein KCU58_01550 [Xanthomonas translucens pv. undulosa]UKE43757.1 hypothetical protein KAF26_01550 [Xanthomonas translucens pv. secalis]
MPDEKAVRILGSKTDLTQKEILALSNEEAWDRIYALRKDKAKDNRLQVCFSGFGESRKSELKSMATQAGLKNVTSITKNLDFLCTGATPGPTKLQQANDQGVQLLTEQDFLRMLSTGELPSET